MVWDGDTEQESDRLAIYINGVLAGTPVLTGTPTALISLIRSVLVTVSLAVWREWLEQTKAGAGRPEALPTETQPSHADHGDRA